MNKTLTRIISSVTAVIVFAGAFYIYQEKPFSKDKKTAEAAGAEMPAAPGPSGQGGPIPVRAMVIQPGPLRDFISVNGSTVANEEVTITSEVPGKIDQILFREGQFVKKGAPLVQLETDELEAQRQRLLVQQNLTEKIAERMKNLYDKEGVSLQEYEIAEAEAQQVRAELDLLNVQIEKRTITSPFNGLLGLRQVSEGSYLSPGAPIINLISTNPIHIEFSVPEKYGNVISDGRTIQFELDGMPGVFEARVIAREPNIDAATRTLKLKAAAPNPNGKILPGAFAKVTVNLQQFNNAIMVPTEAIIPEMGGKKVFLYRNGLAEATAVETGIRKETMIQVISGLQNGDTLITTGVLQIRSGAPVAISVIEP